MATGDLLAAVNTATTTFKGFQFQGFSTTVRSSFTGTSNTYGITWHTANGNVVWGNANPTTSIKQGTGFTQVVTSSFDWSPGNATYDLHWDNVGGNLYSLIPGTKVWKHSGFSATVSASISQGTSLRGIALDGVGGDSFTQDATGQKARRNTGFTTTVASSFTNTNCFGGCSWDGTNYYSESENGPTYPHFRKHTGFTSTVASSFEIGTNVNYFGIHYEVDKEAAKRLLLMGVGT